MTFPVKDLKPNTIQATIEVTLTSFVKDICFDKVWPKDEFRLLSMTCVRGGYSVSLQLYPSLSLPNGLYKDPESFIGKRFRISNVYSVMRDGHLEVRSEPADFKELEIEKVEPKSAAVDATADSAQDDVVEQSVASVASNLASDEEKGIRVRKNEDDIDVSRPRNISQDYYQQVFGYSQSLVSQ